MYILRHILIVIVLIVFFISASFAVVKDLGYTPLICVLSYHHLDLSPKIKTPYTTDSKVFIEQMKALKTAGFTFITLKQIEDYIYQRIQLPRLCVAITFDDGNLNTYTVAYPLLKKMGIPFAMFIYPTGIMNGHKRGYVTWDELKDMAKNGVEIASHTFDHPYLTLPPKTVKTYDQYAQWLNYELAESKKIIETKIGVSVNYIAYPFGLIDRTVYNKVRQTGYSLGFNVNDMTNSSLSDPLYMNRIIVVKGQTPKGLVAKALLHPIYFDMVYPGHLSRTTSSNFIAKFKMKYPQRYFASSVRLSVSRMKGVSVNLVPKVTSVSINTLENVEFESKLYPVKEGAYLASVKAYNTYYKSSFGNWYFLYNKTIPSYIPSKDIY